MDNSRNQIISIVYRITIALLSLILGVGFLVYGAQLHCKIRENATLAKAKRNIYILASLCSASLIVSAAFFVIVALWEDFDNNIAAMSATFILSLTLLTLSVIMIITEICPGFGILILLDVKALAKAQNNTSSLSSSKGHGPKSLYEKSRLTSGSGTGKATGSATISPSSNSTNGASTTQTSASTSMGRTVQD